MAEERKSELNVTLILSVISILSPILTALCNKYLNIQIDFSQVLTALITGNASGMIYTISRTGKKIAEINAGELKNNNGQKVSVAVSPDPEVQTVPKATSDSPQF